MSLCLLILLYGPKADGSNNPSPRPLPDTGRGVPPSRFGKGAGGVRSHPPLPLTLGDNAHPQGFHLSQHAAKARVGL
jgi:hypothetical protein